MLLCEAAGFDVILVETVGVGQSEIAVADMTDFFLVLMLPGAGDELQGIKKGIVELADMIAVNKADGDNVARAKAAAAEYRAALHILTPRSPNWAPPVVTYSALTGDGIADAVGSMCSTIATSSPRPASSRRGGASSRSSGCGRCSTSVCSRRCAPTAALKARAAAIEAGVAARHAFARRGGRRDRRRCSGADR